MVRRVGFFNLGLIVVVLAGALLSSQAAAEGFTAQKYPATVTGSLDFGTDLLTTTAGTVSCKTSSTKGTLAHTSSTISLAPSFSECTALGLAGTIDVNGCTYLLHVEGGGSIEGDVDLVCPAGQEMTITAGNPTVRCTIHIPPQSDIAGTVTYTDIGEGTTQEITVDLSLTGIDYKHTIGTGIGACASGSATNGTLSGKEVLKGENEGGTEHVGLSLT